MRVAFPGTRVRDERPGRLTDLRLAQWQRQLRSSGSTKNSGDTGADVTLRRISNYFCHLQAPLAK
jgi:hypothetical protein